MPKGLSEDADDTSSEEESVAPKPSKETKHSLAKAMKISTKESAASTAQAELKKKQPEPSSESEQSPSETDDTSADEETSSSAGEAEETADSAAETDSNSDDDSTAMQNALVVAVARLRGSQVSSKTGWSLLRRLGCDYSGTYTLPNSNLRFANQNDLVHHILKKSILELDLSTNPLPKDDLKTLHRYLKFHFVSLSCGEAVGNALTKMSNSHVITELLEKIGFTAIGNGCYEHRSENMEGQYDLPQVINLIRSHREDLMLIGQDNSKRSREKKPKLPADEDLTLRIFAAESDVPLQFFDEETLCAEAMAANDAMDDDDDANPGVFDGFNMHSENSHGGERVLSVEEADASNSGFVDHSNRDDSTELLSRTTVPQSRSSEHGHSNSAESHPLAPSYDVGLREGFGDNASHSRDFGNRSAQPFLTQEQPDESEDENDHDSSAPRSQSLFSKAIMPHANDSGEVLSISHSGSATEDNNMENGQADDLQLPGETMEQRSHEMQLLVSHYGSHDSAHSMEESNGGRNDALSTPNPLGFMTQECED